MCVWQAVADGCPARDEPLTIKKTRLWEKEKKAASA